MLNSSLQPDMNSSAGYGTPYSLPFLSPMIDSTGVMGPSVSPISMGHGDPIIAGTSPPLSHLHRSDSSELFPESYDHHANLSDDGTSLSELYSKQSLAMSGGSPTAIDDSDGVDMQHIMHYPMSQSVSPEENMI
jgi:hypothetical protein